MRHKLNGVREICFSSQIQVIPQKYRRPVSQEDLFLVLIHNINTVWDLHGARHEKRVTSIYTQRERDDVSVQTP